MDYSGNRQTVQGQWHRYGESHVSFSNQFIKVPGEDLNALPVVSAKACRLNWSMQIILIPEKPTASVARIDVRVCLGWKEFPGNGVLTKFDS
jgi:hypothetical protein